MRPSRNTSTTCALLHRRRRRATITSQAHSPFFSALSLYELSTPSSLIDLIAFAPLPLSIPTCSLLLPLPSFSFVMPIIRNALSSVLGDTIASSDERSLRRQAERLEKDARKAGRHGSGGVNLVAMQALQTQLSYEIVKQQRYARLGDMVQAERCQGIIAALQQQLAAYQPMQQPMYQQIVYQQPMQQQQPLRHVGSRNAATIVRDLPNHATTTTTTTASSHLSTQRRLPPHCRLSPVLYCRCSACLFRPVVSNHAVAMSPTS